MLPQVDLFGQTVEKNELLRDKFIIPPFSVLDTKSGDWQKRRRLWLSRGTKSEVGRSAKAYTTNENFNKYDYFTVEQSDTSIFDPVLCEVIYHWFTKSKWSKILDPFAGGSVRGIVAA